MRLCVGVWLLILLVPTLRFVANTSRTTATGWEVRTLLKQKPLAAAAMREEKLVVATQNAEDYEAEEDYRLDSHAYDALMRSYPDDTVVIAAQLRHRISYMDWVRAPHYVGERRYQMPVASQPSTGDFQRELRLTRRAQKLEPQNAFFDVVEMVLLSSVRRDEEAFRVLERGSRKTSYDDHSLELLRARDLVNRQHGFTGAEHQSLLALESNYSRSYSFARAFEMLLWLSWRGEIKSQSLAEKQSFLLRRAAFARLATKARLAHSAHSSDLWSNVVLSAWSSDLSRRPRWKIRNFSIDNQALGNGFASRARLLKLPQIVPETINIQSLLERMQVTLRSQESDQIFFARAWAIFTYLQRLILWQIGFSVGLYGLASLLLWRAEAAPFSQRDARQSATNAAIWATIILLYAYWNVYTHLRWRDYGTVRSLDFVLWTSWFLIVPFTSSMWAHWKRSHQRELWPHHINRWQWYINQFSKLPLERKILDVLAYSILFQIGVYCVFLIFNILRRNFFVAVPLPFLRAPYFLMTTWEHVATALAVAIFVFIAHRLVVWRWPNHEKRQYVFHATLRSYRSVLSYFIATGHVLFLASLLFTFPARSAVNETFNSYLQNGQTWLYTRQTSHELIKQITN